MPFVKKNDPKSSPAIADAQKIFIGRINELTFFTEHILAPLDPTYNILSIYGDGGVGKSTLVNRFIDEVHTSRHKDYCLVALVDERQATPASMMEKFAEQLRMDGPFKRAMLAYKDALRRQQVEQETMQDALLQRAPDFAGAAVEGVPFVGPLLREGVKLTTSRFVNTRHAGQTRHDLERLEDPIGNLTKAFVGELNRIADTQVTFEMVGRDKAGSYGRRPRRIVLIFDTFEQLAAEAAPWLLDHFLTVEISSNIVLLTAGRIPIERSLPDDPKRWLPYHDSNSMYSICLNSFTEEETHTYLARRSITDLAKIDKIWRLSHGLPLYLSLLTANPHNVVDPTADVVNNFLRWIPEHEEMKRRLVLDAALFSRPFSQDELAAFAYMPEQQRPALFRWLIKQPFVRRSPQDGHYSYHEVAEELFSRHLLQSAPNTCYATRQALAAYYQEHLISVQDDKKTLYLAEWFSLSIALAQQLFLLPDSVNHIKAVEHMLDAYIRTKQDEEITRVLREVALEHKSNQATYDARQVAHSLLQYIEAEPMSEEFLATASNLLTHIANAKTFSSTLLAAVYGNRGVAYRNLNDYQHAIEDFNRALQLDPPYAWAYGNRGITYRALRQHDKAIQDFTAALALDDTLDWVYVGRGEAFRHRKEYLEAVADFDRAIALDPDYAQAYAGRGRVYRLLKRYQQAIEDFDHALLLDPEIVLAYGFRGLTYSQMKQYTLALEDFTYAIALNVDYFWAYGSRGVTYFSLKDYQHAIEDLNHAIALNPSYAWGYAQRGRTYRHLKIYDKAIADLDRALALDPQDAWSYSHRGLAYSSLQQFAKAIQDFDHAIALGPSYGRAYGRRGSAYLGLQNLEQAKADYERNYELDATDIRAGWMSEWIGMCQHHADLVTVERLEHIAQADSQHYMAYVCRAVSFWLRGFAERAETELVEAVAMKPDMWDALFWQGIVALSQGKQEGNTSIERAKELSIPTALLAIHRTLMHVDEW
ncbi:MAG: hypothetical protein NVS4B11_23340 [Ktedonobacteraceae bacterium]